MGKPKNKAVAAAAEPTATLVETSLFEPDDQATDADKNSTLATLLNTAWHTLAIVRVERIEIGDSGWRVVFRQ